MLNFYNKRIYLDFEIFDTLEDNIIMFTDNPYTTKRNPNETYLDVISVHELRQMPQTNIFMNVGQFKGFIKYWIHYSKLNTTIDYNVWVEDYFKSIKMFSDIMGEDYDYTSHNSLFRQRQKWLIDNLEITEEVSPIRFKKPSIPELSFVIDDVLYSRRKYLNSDYIDIFNKNIEINKYKCLEYQSCANILGRNYLNFNTYNNCESLDDLCYLYFPLSGEHVNSNVIHIEKCLRRYVEKKC